MLENTPPTCSEYVAKARHDAIQTIYNWAAELPEDLLRSLQQPGRLTRITQLTFIDGYWRIRETTRLILQAIDTLSSRNEYAAAQFWIKHLSEEYAHDVDMLQDLARIFGSEEAASQELTHHPASPPITAISGFFDWHTRHGNPHLLILLRDFLENFVTEMRPEHVQQIHNIAAGRASVLALHQELDTEHVLECVSYIDRYFQPHQAGELSWIVHFIGARIRDVQIWSAKVAAIEAGEI